jgi:serine/threonine-protein kinase
VTGEQAQGKSCLGQLPQATNLSDLPTQLQVALADRYRLDRELGQGGMAMVYLAQDIKHDRPVAVKVLRAELGAILGAERFLAEIRITAKLDHPHILTLIDSGEAGGLLYYVLPFIRGESLRDKLNREQQLGIEAALAIARQVASALDHAHRQGVIHRDIKPENILLHEGEAMLADFGIALAVKEAGGNRLTETGLSLGTPQYMSPEQATGDRLLTARSDVYSLAAVVYEMLAGEPPVTGPNAQAMVAKLMTERPVSLRVVRDTVPEAMDLAVQKALAKVPADRFASAGEFARALEMAHTATPERASAPGTRPFSRRAGPGARRWLPWAAGGSLLALVAAYWASRSPTPPRLELGRSEQLTAEPGLEIQPALSPDGKLVAYSAGNSSRMRVFLRPVGGGRTIPLSDDSTSVETHPQWSPDGSSLLFLTRGGVSVSPALGGSSRAIVPPAAQASVMTATWSPSGREIAFARGDSILVVPAGGGPARLVGTGAYDVHSCSWSPNGKWIACVAGNSESVFPGEGFGNLAPSTVVLFPAGGGKPIGVVESRVFNQSPAWSPDGSRLLLVSNRDGPRDIYALLLSSSGRPKGEPTRLTTGLGAISVSLSADGRLLSYAVYSAQANLWSVPVAAGGSVTAKSATQVTSSHQVIESARVSRDGRWLLYDSDLRGNADIYRVPIAGGQPEQLTNDPADEFAPDLSPDGRAVAYHTFRHGTRDIEVKPLDGGPVESAASGPGQESFPVWSPDGGAILFFDQAVHYPLFIVRRGAGGRWLAPEQLTIPGAFPDWSPDGHDIAYASSLPAAQPRLLVIPAAGGAPRRVFDPGPAGPWAEKPLWSPDGRTLYFKSHDAEQRASFWAVSATGSQPRMLARLSDPNWQSIRPFFATDGKRFYFPVEDRESDIYLAEVMVR